ncbi:hypothetical protein [Pedobacter sp.]|uniref:hypothetical protein n=1 Tax=Pedobacter sp. TaxID=1411316 RepID=UPI003BA9FE6D
MKKQELHFMSITREKLNKTHHSQESTVSISTFVITLSAAIIIIFSLWASKSIESRSISLESKKENQELRKKLSAKLDSTLKNQLLVFTKPLVWAIRNKLVEGDMKSVNMYLGQFVTDQNFKEVSVINNNGLIIASSKKTEIGHFYSTFYNRNFLSTDSARLNIQRGNDVIITSPVFGRNGRMATLSIHYLMPGKE